MRCVVQRVSRARVLVDGEVVGAIERGLLVFVGAVEGDSSADVAWLDRKLVALRVFPDADGRMNLSIQDIAGSLLLVSQFTLAAQLDKGARPSFAQAMRPECAEPLLEELVGKLKGRVSVATGRFRAHMEVELVNDGPMTLWLDSKRA